MSDRLTFSTRLLSIGIVAAAIAFSFLPLFAHAASYTQCTSNSQCSGGQYCDLCSNDSGCLAENQEYKPFSADPSSYRVCQGNTGASPVRVNDSSSNSSSSGNPSSPPVVIEKPTDLPSLARALVTIINDILVPILFAVAFLVFLWGVFKYFIAGAADEEARTKGRMFILYGVIGFFVMVSVWGLVNILTGTFGLNTEARPSYPTL